MPKATINAFLTYSLIPLGINVPGHLVFHFRLVWHILNWELGNDTSVKTKSSLDILCFLFFVNVKRENVSDLLSVLIYVVCSVSCWKTKAIRL